MLQTDRAASMIPQREQICALMAYFFDAEGCCNIHAAARGFPPPEIIRGVLGDYAPDIHCERPDSRGSAVLLDIIGADGAAISPREFSDRITLFASFTDSVRGELHLACPPARSGELRTMLRGLGVRPARIWELGSDC